METKVYSERVRLIKNEVLDEVRNLMGTETRYAFERPPFVHYVEGQVATVEYCMAIEIGDDDMIVFKTGSSYITPKSLEKVTEGDDIYLFEPDSFFNILDTMKKEIREKKLNTLRELVKKAGGEIDFDGNFEFFGTRGTMLQKTKLMGVEIDDKGEFMFDCIAAEDGECWRDDSYPDTDQIDHIIEYVRKQTEKSPEERLALTDEQKAIVGRIKKEVTDLRNLGGAIMLDNDYGTLFAVNVKDEEFNLSDTDLAHQTRVDIAKLPQDDVIGDGYVCYTSEGIYLK